MKVSAHLVVRLFFFFILLPVLVPQVVLAYHFHPSYDIRATFDDKKGSRPTIKGSVEITFSNPATVSLNSIPLILYPNRYLKPPEALPADIFRRSFPKPYSQGKMELTNAEDSAGHPLKIECPDPLLGENVICQLQLADPVAPGQSITLKVSFTTTIPERLGGFGFFKSTVALEGGWHPYLPDFEGTEWKYRNPPPRSQFLLHLDYPLKFELNHTGSLVEKILLDDSKSITIRSENTNFLTLIFSTRYTDMISEKPKHVIYYSYFSKDKRYATKVMKTAEEALQFFEDEIGPSKAMILRIAEAYLYEDLYAEGEEIVLVSHVMYKLMPGLKSYHEARLVHGIYTHLWRAQIPWAEDWIIQMLADHTSQAFLFKKLNHPLVGIEKYLKPFAFLPIVDQILYTPNSSFREIFLKEGKPLPFRENVRLFNTPRAEGTGILFKLKNLLGNDKATEIVDTYIRLIKQGERPSFTELSQSLAQKDLKWFYDQWLNSYPEPDFSLSHINRESSDKHQHTTRIEVDKKGEGIEPVTVKATLSDDSSVQETRLFTQSTEEFIFKSQSPVKIVEIDPEHETNDPNLFNNRDPHQWKFLLDKFNGSLDIQSHTPEIEFGGSFRRMYDNNNIFGIYYYNQQDVRGVRGDFTHTFTGEPNSRFRNAIGGNIKSETALLVGQNDENRGSIGLNYQIGYLGYSLTLEYNQQFSGPEHPVNGRVSLETRNERRWSPYHALSFISRLGEQSGPLSTPFLAGAGMGLRGYKETTVSGSNFAVFSLEYDFPFIYELDRNLVGITLLHTLQGKLFLDTGNASEERNLFLFNQYLSDFGGGIYQEFDLFGAYPTSVSFLIGYPISSPIPDERMNHYYLNFGIHF